MYVSQNRVLGFFYAATHSSIRGERRDISQFPLLSLRLEKTREQAKMRERAHHSLLVSGECFTERGIESYRRTGSAPRNEGKIHQIGGEE